MSWTSRSTMGRRSTSGATSAAATSSGSSSSHAFAQAVRGSPGGPWTPGEPASVIAGGLMPLSTLCQRCGLCCDGTLFTHVPLQDTEAAPLQALGLPVKEREDGTRVLPQRCAALEGRRCTAYSARPEGCRRYHC